MLLLELSADTAVKDKGTLTVPAAGPVNTGLLNISPVPITAVVLNPDVASETTVNVLEKRPALVGLK